LRPLPPVPPIQMDRLRKPLEAANHAIGRLDGLPSVLPDTPLFLYMYVRKVALVSSQIEGIQSSLSGLLLFESEAAPGAISSPCRLKPSVISSRSMARCRIDRLTRHARDRRIIKSDSNSNAGHDEPKAECASTLPKTSPLRTMLAAVVGAISQIAQIVLEIGRSARWWH
jgi:hypothetical protein